MTPPATSGAISVGVLGETATGQGSRSVPAADETPAAPDGPSVAAGRAGARWRSAIVWVAFACLAALFATLIRRLAAPAPVEQELAGYATSLVGRTASQRFNARKAAEALDGAIIMPGALFSFNRVVKSWSFDQGFLKAPVSYDGELVRAYGGGVCQTSTTLYNAALLSGLPIVERHAHVFTAHYVPPGRDAAVAQYTIDLRFRNPYPWPIRIRTATDHDRLAVRIYGGAALKSSFDIETHVLDTVQPHRYTRVDRRASVSSSRTYMRSPGAEGCRVVTYRVCLDGAREIHRERLSDDTYDAMDRVVQVTEAIAP